MSDYNQWMRTWRLLGVNHERLPITFEQLVGCYNEPHRHYHTMQHIKECFEHLEAVRSEITYLPEVEIALWFHDVIYNTHNSDNEIRSAAWARTTANFVNLNRRIGERIYFMVVATNHSLEPREDEKLVVDIDLAILGASTERFQEYDQQVRQEYSWVEDNVFYAARGTMLKEFLNRPFIYRTPYFIDRFEKKARENISNTLSTYPK